MTATDGSSSTGPLSRRRFLASAGMAGAVAIAGCTKQRDSGGGGGDGTSNDGGPLSGKVEISGSSTVYPLSVAIAETFEAEHPQVDANIRKTGTGGGFENYFCTGQTDFNNGSRPITDSETEKCANNGIEPIELTVATDAVTVIVNNEADWVDCMTVEELRQIWEPDGASKWSDVNSDWPDEKLELYGAASTSGTFDYFTEVIVGEEGKSRRDYSATERDNDIIRGVRGSKYALGYLGFAYYSENTDRVKALAIDNGDGNCVKPSLETAKSGEYKPLSRPLFTYPKKSALAKPQVAEFARFFVRQSTNEELVANQVGYVPNTVDVAQEQLGKLEWAIDDVQE
ncbi:MAG TPA: PstS family phosphate ABC transporter substrate-binding protein [Natrialbaceae archaeon]|nr:PstS family phosphate ABC transporter substrate-binding protein [Natrialbaceae archaeon]